jgi:glycosyltransferase involved in cell wall biosynthesis
MSVACPVVAPAVGGLPEILRDGENALVATERSADAIAACLGRVLEDEELRGRLGRGARETIEAGFSAPAMVGRMLEIYREILPREGPDPA